MKLSLLSTLVVTIPMGVNAWVLQSDRQFRTTSHRFMSDADVETTDNPCWQDVYGDADDDCGMSTVYSATFVAEKWIKSMPCGHDVDEDCIPEDLKAPGTRDEAGIDHVDVMNFLDLKRAKPIHAEQERKP
mmetsp:Transcript_8056/g.17400  ORF Transcript_8056/g.17400 Transcript_8056/m.17400 type:complete len:131 (+) Transcript_8056:154-546(+)|eukprot:CAMPEP_0178518758 /NCGR_PEP_ID=MMETSP0696-20121128/26444_1 /TAXON_ID=265572 /ORGANISM="Extubocellulus spinifer, Strain CCMP396" /LENGTH=130 /DNA_ID=CAMNT_0020149375 /DNA_START=96 /DNA_END=488 /DNA_ORIENTATION=+